MVAMCHPCHDHLLRALQITQVLTVAQRDLFLIGVWGPCRILENWNMSWAIPEHTVKHSFQHIPATNFSREKVAKCAAVVYIMCLCVYI